MSKKSYIVLLSYPSFYFISGFVFRFFIHDAKIPVTGGFLIALQINNVWGLSHNFSNIRVRGGIRVESSVSLCNSLHPQLIYLYRMFRYFERFILWNDIRDTVMPIWSGPLLYTVPHKVSEIMVVKASVKGILFRINNLDLTLRK